QPAARGHRYLQVLYRLPVPAVHRPAGGPLPAVDPMTRTQTTVIALVALVALVMGLTVYKALNRSGQLNPALLLDAGIVQLPQSRELPAMTLTDQDGRPQAVDAPSGRWTLLFFGYTFCPDVCPTTLAELRQLQGLLGEED